MSNLTWGVCRPYGTATVFCMQCRAVMATVPINEARDALEASQGHHCTPTKKEQQP